MSERLALFPLDVVLFPGTVVPLHIFEPRYRRLLADCLDADRRFGVVPAQSDGEAPPTGVIGSVALIQAAIPLADGRSNIVVLGDGRFMLRRYLGEDRPYLVGLVDAFEDEPAELDEAGVHVADLRRLGDRCAAALRVLTDGTPTPDWSADAGMLTFQVAGLLEADVTFKQQFLGIRSAVERVRLLLELLPPLADQLEARAVVHRRAGHNGRGGTDPDIVVRP